MTSLRLALKQSLEESSGGFSPPSLGSDNHNSTNNPNFNAPPSSPGGSRTGMSSPTNGASSSAPGHSTSASSINPHNSNLSPQPWKKRGPGRPRKTQPQDGGTAKKRGRPRKLPASEEQPGHEEHSSSENEFSGEENDDIEEEQSREAAEEQKASSKPLKKKKAHSTMTGAVIVPNRESHAEPVESSEVKASVASTDVDHTSSNYVIPSNKEGNIVAHSSSREKEPDEGKPSKVKTVPPPHPRVLSWSRNLPVKEVRQNVKQGIRVKVRFATKAKKEGKRKKKWYGGLVSQVSKAGSKIRIKYDDGTSEVARFPDKDIVVDATFNGEHQCSSEFFDPPEEGMSGGEEVALDHQPSGQEQPETNPAPREKTETSTTATTSGSEHPEPVASALSSSETLSPRESSENLMNAEVQEDSLKPLNDLEAVKSAPSVPTLMEPEINISKDTSNDQPDESLAIKPKRKRGRPPKIRSQQLNNVALNEEIIGPKTGDKSIDPLRSAASPVPTVESTNPLVDTPVLDEPKQKRVLDNSKLDPMEVEEPTTGKDHSEKVSAQMGGSEEDKQKSKLLSIRIPKLKSSLEEGSADSSKNLPTKPEKSPRPAIFSESKKDQENHGATKRIHIHLAGPKSVVAKETKEIPSTHESQHSTIKGRTTPVPIVSAHKHEEEEVRTPASPRSKKVKRKRVESSPNSNRPRSPRSQAEEASEKFGSAGSAFEKSTSGGSTTQVVAEEEENSKAVTPKGRPAKVDAARSARRSAAKEASDRLLNKQEETVVKKKKKRDRRREVEGEDSDREETQQQAPWVQCDKCKKWRIIPSEVVGSLPERWFCEDNVWDPKRASCDAPQQKDKQVVREKKRRKRQRLMEKAAAESRATADIPAGAVSDESNEHENSAASRSQEDMEEVMKRPRRASPTENSDSSMNNNEQKTEKKSNTKKLRSHTAEVMELQEDEGGADLKPRGRGRPRRNLVKETCTPVNPEQTHDEADNVEWVQCEKCDKWRKLPPHISADELPEVWYCSMNTWNPASASCSAPEDKAEAGLTDIFSNGAAKLSYRNLIFGNGRKFNRPISERTRAAESLFAAVSDDADAPPTVTYASSSAFISRSKLNQPEETDGLSVLELMSRSQLWKELHAIAAATNGGLCAFDRLSNETKEYIRDLILHSLGSRTMSGEEVANDIQHRNWQNVPLGWAAAKPHCTVNIIVMTMCELVKEGVLECMKEFDGRTKDSFFLTYRRAKSYSQATLQKPIPCQDGGEVGPRCMKFAKPWKSAEGGDESIG